MRLGRHVYTPESADEPGASAGPLRSGTWLVQAGSTPPRAHLPGLLLAGAATEAGLAVTLTSACALRRDLGVEVIRLAAGEGCAVTPLAALALHETVLNAVIHGNLAVDSGPAREWQDLAMREDHIADALRDPARAARLVTVAAGWNARCLVAVVADQGNGYRPKDWTRQEAEHARRAGAGRGLMIARAAAQVDVLRGGSCTRLTFPCLHAPLPPGARAEDSVVAGP